MKLYHGTSSTNLKNILLEGAQPRKNRGPNKGNWEHTVSSRNDSVYLTDIYAPYFAFCASKNTNIGVVLEVDVEKLDSSKFIPDEDYLEQATRGKYLEGLPKGMVERTKYFRKHAHKNNHLWRRSLEKLGTCAYRSTIHRQSITRIAMMDFKLNPDLMMICCDSSISLLNHKFCSEKYRVFTKWIFDADVSLDEWCIANHFITDAMPSEMQATFETTKEQFKEFLSNRTGISVTAL